MKCYWTVNSSYWPPLRVSQYEVNTSWPPQQKSIVLQYWKQKINSFSYAEKKKLWRMCTNFWINPHNGKLPSRLAPAQCQNSLTPQLLSNIYWSKTKTSISLNRVYWYDTMCHIFSCYFCFVLWSGYFTLKKIKDISPTNDDKIYAVKTDFVSQVYIIRTKIHVDRMHWNCLALQQSTSSVHPFFHPKPRNCSHQIDPFPARNNPSNACLFVRFTTSIAECKLGFATERYPVPVDTPPDEMSSCPLHIGKPVTSRHYLTF